jgi:lipopolysaccharide/colanic/teichoic acid biosynthesis glycosyltransferase
MATPPSSRRRARFRLRYPVATSILVTLLLTFVSMLTPTSEFDGVIITYTAVGCVVASLVMIYLLRNVGNYPGVEEYSYLLPAFCVAFGTLLAVLILARIPYSRFLLTSCFVVNFGVFTAIHVLLRRRSRPRIGLVPIGDYARLLDIQLAEWHLLDDPNADVDGFDSISVDLWCDPSDEWERALASFALRGLPVYHSKHLLESLTGKVEIERLSENHFGTLSPLYSYMRVKHVADWLMALVGLIVLMPVFIVVSLIIKLDSSGPVIFRQTRMGYQGRPFRVFKFRTMTAARDVGDAQSARDAAMTKDNDHRVTRFGRFLRTSRIDELPQMINVLKGEMSWIGPRPEAEILSRWYESEIPFYRYRHIVRPGITGWAQVYQGHVADVDDVREKLHFDFYYIKNFSLWLDVIVVGRTIRTVLTGFGSR